MVKYSRKPTFRKSAPKKKMSTRRKTNSIARTIKSIMNRNNETKNTIVAVTESTVSTLTSPTSNNIQNVNNLLIGNSHSTRIGNKVNGKYLNIRGSVYFPDDVTTIYTKLMILQCQEDDDPINDLLETNGANFSAASTDLSAIYARVNTTRYKVLATRVLKTGVTGGLQQTQLFNITVKLGNASMRYEQGSGVNVCSDKKLVFVYFSRRGDNDETLGLNGEISWNSKFYYTDM